MARFQEEMTKKGLFLRPSELNGRSHHVVGQFQNLLGITIRMWVTFSFLFQTYSFDCFFIYFAHNV